MKIYQVGSYALTVQDDKIISFELVETKGGLVPKIGQLFTVYCFKVGISPIDITPYIKSSETIFSIDKMDAPGWFALFGNPCRGQVR